jgi:peptidoglycan hydrolase CwlO-like protein
MGFVDETNDTVQKRGHQLPVDFYFQLGNLPYGLSNIKFRYENQGEESIIEQKRSFYQNQQNRRIHSLEKNIHNIEQTIKSLEDKILDNIDDFVVYNSVKPEIEKLMEKSILYKIEIRKLEKSLAEMTV